MIKIAFLGDIMLGRSVTEAIVANGPDYPWGDTRQILSEADLRIGNLECPISDQGAKWKRKKFHFRASPRAIDALKAARIDCVALANNHIMDYGLVAMEDTIRLLDDAGIGHAGAGSNQTQAMTPAFLKAGGLEVAFLSVTDDMPVWQATEEKAGINYIPLRSWPRSFRTLRPQFILRPPVEYVIFQFTWREIMKTVQKGLSLAERADITVLSCHWGPNFRAKPYSIFKKFARKLIESGVDVIHGHSAHLFQGVGKWKNKPILFDTGDFLEDFEVDQFRSDLSFIFMLDFNPQTKRAEKITLFPIYISKCQSNLASDSLADTICGKMQRLCAKMGMKAQRDGRNLVVEMVA